LSDWRFADERERPPQTPALAELTDLGLLRRLGGRAARSEPLHRREVTGEKHVEVAQAAELRDLGDPTAHAPSGASAGIQPKQKDMCLGPLRQPMATPLQRASQLQSAESGPRSG
jgi:hypothetical protein